MTSRRQSDIGYYVIAQTHPRAADTNHAPIRKGNSHRGARGYDQGRPKRSRYSAEFKKPLTIVRVSPDPSTRSHAS